MKVAQFIASLAIVVLMALLLVTSFANIATIDDGRDCVEFAYDVLKDCSAPSDLVVGSPATQTMACTEQAHVMYKICDD